MKLGNSRRSRAVTAKKCTKKEYCTCKTVVLSVLTHSDFFRRSRCRFRCRFRCRRHSDILNSLLNIQITQNV